MTHIAEGVTITLPKTTFEWMEQRIDDLTKALKSKMYLVENKIGNGWVDHAYYSSDSYYRVVTKDQAWEMTSKTIENLIFKLTTAEKRILELENELVKKKTVKKRWRIFIHGN